jgi:hypothetical protein
MPVFCKSVDIWATLAWGNLTFAGPKAEFIMTVTLHLKPEAEAGLLTQAQASGVVLEEYVLTLIEEEAALPSSGKASTAERQERAESVRRMLEFGDKHHLSLDEPITRASLDEGHRF